MGCPFVVFFNPTRSGFPHKKTRPCVTRAVLVIFSCSCAVATLFQVDEKNDDDDAETGEWKCAKETLGLDSLRPNRIRRFIKIIVAYFPCYFFRLESRGEQFECGFRFWVLQN